MSKREWAAIIYGRSYHLDFRFITVPDNFTGQDLNWASQYILATTQQARNLADSPRWSLFKNDDYCIVGVTCMVRDLIGQLNEDSLEVMTKDDRGRPLYVFVGYVTQLTYHKNLQDFPAYTEERLDSFQTLYHEIEKVWLVKDYEQDTRNPLLSQYQPLSFAVDLSATNAQILQLNDRSKYPQKTYLWPSFTQQNNLLWLTSAQCPRATSTCLNIKGKALINSPFLNQTITQLDRFKIQDRIVAAKKSKIELSPDPDSGINSSLSQKISHRAKEDIDITLQQAAKVATASQELINSFTDWSNPSQTTQNQPGTSGREAEFGFKTKKTTPSDNQDWF
ncbi:MAG: hypothetical protein ACFCU7_04295 [Pleurocapsa sp.]